MIYVRLEPCATRLGNWMFQYASAKKACPDEPVTFVIKDKKDWEAVQKYSCFWSDARYVCEAPAGVNVRKELYQDVKFLDMKQVQKIFSCPEWIREHLQNKYGMFLNGNSVGISVRRGDYLRLPHRHPFVGEAYLKKAVESFPRDSVFIVCSDDIPWCKRFFVENRFIERRFVFVEGEEVLAQLFIHTMCKHNIISNSTFSWWGGYLNPNQSKRVIFPSMWYGVAIKNANCRGLYFDGSEVVTNGYTLDLWLKAQFCMMKTCLGNVLRKMRLR